MALTEDQSELLMAIGSLYDGDELMYSAAMGVGETIEHPAKEGRIAVKRGTLLELADLGFVAFEARPHGGNVRLTGEGREKLDELSQVADAQRPKPMAIVPAGANMIPLDWQTEALPVLKATAAAAGAADAHRGIMSAAINAELGRDQNDPQTGRVLDKLVEAGYLTSKVHCRSGRGAALGRFGSASARASRWMAHGKRRHRFGLLD